MSTQLIFNISQLIDQSTGTRETYSFEIPLAFEGFTTKSDTSGKADIMRMDEGFNAKLDEVEVDIQFECERCLKKFTKNIAITMAERQFLFKSPEKIDDPNDLYLVNNKDSTIDLSELLRQEIILHFPLIPVCSKSCKGICPICGKNRNKESCKCEPLEIEEVNKPLAALKDLFKKS